MSFKASIFLNYPDLILQTIYRSLRALSICQNWPARRLSYFMEWVILKVLLYKKFLTSTYQKWYPLF